MTISHLYETYNDSLHRFAERLARDADWADDLVQETFLQAMANLDLLQQLNPFQVRAWLFKVVKNYFLDQLRRTERRQNLLAQWSEGSIDENAATAFVAQFGILDLVPAHYRDVLEKHYFLGMTSEEIGKELAIPSATVRSRLRLAINWLRAHPNDLI